MTDDVNYCHGISIYDNDVRATSPIHMPCPDMEGLSDFDPKKTERSLSRMEMLREELGLNKRQRQSSNNAPLNYICTESKCLEPWEIKRKPKHRTKPRAETDAKWRTRLAVKANNLPDRAVQRQGQNETTQH
ncbi:hypothetical protein [Vibrio diabolicus]|uniref:hypothetical protein n=1 Tax=Vibrio diabolicus TaxID=50719 RepID=UPI0015F389E4|nr:hypothetical protein [Vibrio diabolicus]